MYLIDTNIFLEILLEQDKTSDCENFLEKIRVGEIKDYLTSFGLHSIEVILSDLDKNNTLEIFLQDIMTFTNLEIIYTNIIDELKAIRFIHLFGLDFDDVLH